MRDVSDDWDRIVIDSGLTGVLILPTTHERMELGEWRIVRKELIAEDHDVLPHIELKVGVEGSWNTDQVVGSYTHRPWYMIDHRLRLELHNHQHRWELEVEPWESKCFPLEPECETGRTRPEGTGSAFHRFYVHEARKYPKTEGI